MTIAYGVVHTEPTMKDQNKTGANSIVIFFAGGISMQVPSSYMLSTAFSADDLETTAIHLFLAFYPQNDVARCMKAERITKMSLVNCEGNVRARFAEARRKVQNSARVLHPRNPSRVGLVLLSIRHDGACDYETVYPLYFPVPWDLKPNHSLCPYWEELLAFVLHHGPDADMETQAAWCRGAEDMRLSYSDGLASNWDWDWYPQALDHDTGK